MAIRWLTNPDQPSYKDYRMKATYNQANLKPSILKGGLSYRWESIKSFLVGELQHL